MVYAIVHITEAQLVFTNPRMWNQMMCEEDAELRVSVMNMLLSSLCRYHPVYAFSLLEFILRDQCSCFNPIGMLFDFCNVSWGLSQ